MIQFSLVEPAQQSTVPASTFGSVAEVNPQEFDNRSSLFCFAWR